MDYFLLKQDERYKDLPVITQLSGKIDIKNLNYQDIHNVADTVIFYVKATPESSYLDILNRDLFLVSEKLKNLFEKYQPDALFKTIVLIDSENKKQEKYFLPVFKKVDALSPKCEFTRDKSVITKLILKKEGIMDHKIFSVSDGAKPTIIVRLDAAESILRRYLNGICLKRIPVED
ncbi:imm11 family protein [Pseudobacteroides cellulosolvens]|uniref:Immunity MXAN-0049 protein domain-containing protein n=1 Tax=Pseudobacteroides cellulosolvens ATCC 35603 = DSM 2933 TaxID=398512 RepID=A0A0L6JRC6_9FIRM|nr:DUF1629 domain-containing protein [Pseudobacteroides cellulosolvens]KNY27947.1 hypothetical protein Bccel_3218 [Pseudobacteroides cellulosolvens ATCC 35603 = DSM 2933]